MMQKAIEQLHKEASIWASLFLLALFAIGAKTGISFDLLFVALSGFYLCARFQMRGCCYALALLLADVLGRHTFLIHDHLFQLGIECSLGCTFLITALAFEQGAGIIESLSSQLSTRETALGNLEEDFTRAQQEALNQQLLFQEKIASLQKELEEVQTEHSSILILNEVLRKTTARHLAENSSLSEKLLNAERRSEQLENEYLECEKELLRVKESDSLAIANAQLVQELNQARVDKAQTHLINETIARLYVKENLKAKEADEEAAALSEQLAHARKLAPRVETQAEEIRRLNGRIEELEVEASQFAEKLQAAQKEQVDVEPFLNEIAQLQKDLAKAKESQSVLRIEEPNPALYEELNLAHAQITKLAQLEPQLRQLRQQFDEKNKVLHQVRSELFKTDTQLQTLLLEKAAGELDQLPQEVGKEFTELAKEYEALKEENQELEEIITILNSPSPVAEKRKKKVKIPKSSEENSQELLF